MLTSGNIDRIAAGIGHTLEREQAVDFTVTYFENVTQFLVKTGSRSKATRIAPGRPSRRYKEHLTSLDFKVKKSTAKPLTYQEYSQAVLAVLDGKADALMGDDATLLRMTHQNKGVQVGGDRSRLSALARRTRYSPQRFEVA